MDFKKSVWLFAFLLACQSIALAQNFQTKIYLVNGESYTGEIVAITDDVVLLKSTPNVVSIKRDDILYMIPGQGLKPTSRLTESKPKLMAKPFTHKWMSEVESGLTITSPFAFRFGYREWLRMNDKWHVGLGSSVQFFRFSMVDINASIRRLGQGREFIKPFFEAQYGISYAERITQIHFNRTGFWGSYPYKFSPVQQGSMGLGVWMDTSLGVVFTTKASLSFTHFQLEEQFNPANRLDSQYNVTTLAFTTSFIF